MSVTAVRGVLLDATGTLFRFLAPIGTTYATVARTYGFHVHEEKVEASFHKWRAAAPPLAWPKAVGRSSSYLEGLERRWWRSVVWRTFTEHGPWVDTESFDLCFDELYSLFATPDPFQVYDDVVPTLQEIHRRGLHIAVVSNSDSRLYAILKGLGLDRYVDHVVTSTGVGFPKPKAQIFQHTLDAMGLHPAEAIHVGDSYEKDVKGARRVGILPILLERERKYHLHELLPKGMRNASLLKERAKVRRVASLADVVRFLD